MIVSDIAAYIESQYPVSYQEEYDNSGLLIGNADNEISGILVCVDVTPEVIDEALSKNCQMIISHHPLIFSGLKKITGRSRVETMVEKAIRHQLNIYAIHTNLDNHIAGVNRIICEKLGIIDQEILKPKKDLLRKIVTFCPQAHAEIVRSAMFEAGAGQIGNYDCCSFNTEGVGTFRAKQNAKPFVGAINELHFEPEVRIEAVYPVYLGQNIIRAMTRAHPYEEVAYDILILGNENKLVGSGIIGRLPQPVPASEFLLNVKKATGLPYLKYSGYISEIIQKVALCGGAGSFLIPDAIKAGADIFLTGDLKYHEYFYPEGKMLLADIGHYESEQFSKDLIVQLLIRKFPTFAVQKTEIITNPVKFL